MPRPRKKRLPAPARALLARIDADIRDGYAKLLLSMAPYLLPDDDDAVPPDPPRRRRR